MRRELELLVDTVDVEGDDGVRTRLLSPTVGVFTEARAAGQILSAGETAGALSSLGVAISLRVPQGVAGRIMNPRPGRVRAPVGHGALLYELAQIDVLGNASGLTDDEDSREESAGVLLFRSPQSGRFYHRPGPDDEPFVVVGDIVERGQVVGLIEVMKTFAHLLYDTSDGLPDRGRVTAVVIEDGGEVTKGQPLLEIEEV